jgi:hypothetical protein
MGVNMFEVYESNATRRDVIATFMTEDEAVQFIRKVLKVVYAEPDNNYPGCWDAIDKVGRVICIEPA